MKDNLLVVTAMPNPSEQDDLTQYLTQVTQLLMAAGGELVSRCKVSESLAGNGGYAMVLVMRFKDADTIRDVFASESYKSLIKFRDNAFSSIDISIADDLV
jgi:uncharacterized protein (DUF1330 family)